MTDLQPHIVVKFMAKYFSKEQYPGWRRQLPDAAPVWGRCRFEFDQDCRRYDWLAVYDDLSPRDDERFSVRVEPLRCPPEHTVLITAEPSSIKDYGRDFLEQFGVVLTSQEPWAAPHVNIVRTQPGLRWFYGMSGKGRYSYDEMLAHPPTSKTELISTVCSAKHHGTRTLHLARIRFTEQLQQALPELDWFGRGVRPIDDKAEALDAYRYHVVVENHIAPHYWTEKLADAYLGLALPFYCGCPNVADYFPEDSFVPFEVDDVPGAIEIIRKAIADNEYDRRLPALREARRRVLERFNVFASLAREIEARHEPARRPEPGALLYSRRASRMRSVGHFVRSVRDKLRVKLRRSPRR